MVKFDFNKFASAALYFLANANDVGVTKLMKMLYFMDFDFYEQHGRSITGARYVAIDHGPVVDGYRALLNTMEQEGLVRLDGAPSAGGYPIQRLTPLYDWDPADLDDVEREHVQRTAERFKGNTARDLEAASHCDAPWILTWQGGRGRGRVINYALVKRRGEDIEELESEAEAVDPIADLVTAYRMLRHR